MKLKTSGFRKIKIEAGIWDGAYPDGQKVVDVARRNVYGTKNIPARDFRKLAIKAIKANILPTFKKIILNSVKKGAKINITNLEDIGMAMQTEMKQAIIDMDFPPNAPSTVKAKGFDDPLINTRKMFNSVDYKVEYEIE
jgi:hypothetical protein